MDLAYVFVPEGGNVDLYDTVLRIGDSQNPELDRFFRARFENIAWSDLGDQGYFLSTERSPQQTIIAIGGNSEVARFYGFQTLKQLIDPVQKNVAVADIADRPSLIRRGVPIGIQWFRAQDEVFKRMASLKMNFVWVQGSFLNEKFWFRWREPLTAEEKALVKSFAEQAKEHFIVPYIAIAPRGQDASTPTIYSSDSEIDLVVDKMLVLYDMGLRHFGLAFDDLVNVEQDTLFGADVDFFNNDIGAAHVYFTKQIYNRLRAQHPDIQFMLVPMTYDALSHRGDTDETYLEALAQLPEEIGIYSAIERTKGADAAIEFTNRPHMVWDNFWASFYQSDAAPSMVLPLERPTEFSADLISGYSFAPLIPEKEDEYLITWHTAADYAWAPERYDANTSFQLAVAQHLVTSQQASTATTLHPPVLVPDSGIYAPPFSVSIDLADKSGQKNEPAAVDPADVEIRYTIDGSIPTLDSAQYTKPIVLSDGANVRVRARVFHKGVPGNGLSSAFYQVSPQGVKASDIVLERGESLDRPRLKIIQPLTVVLVGSFVTLLAVAGAAYWVFKNRSHNIV